MFNDIISLENLCKAWQEFVCGKRHKKDVAEFALNLSHNIYCLHEDLKNKIYLHGEYCAFNISDPKPRNIHKANVRDRLLHHAIYRILYPYFDKKFIFDSYSCRDLKGTHRAMNRFRYFFQKVSSNNTQTCWVLKCDIRKFFASVDQHILLKIIKKHLSDLDTIWLIEKMIDSFSSTEKGKGLPLGNLTSQLLVNIYMNEFDQFMKNIFKIRYYIRYADDFVVFDTDKDKLLEMTPKVADFLEEELRLSLHPKKVSIETMASGVDYLGWVHFPNHRILRTVTKKRMLKNINMKEGKIETLRSYLGLLSHGNAKKLERKVLIYKQTK